MAQTNVRELFGLPSSEDIFDDFSCKVDGLVTGRMYLTTSNICFYSSILGLTKKFIFPWTTIKMIEKYQSHSIRVIREDKDKNDKNKTTVNVFTGFSGRDISFKYIKRLWTTKSPHATKEKSDSEESDASGVEQRLSVPNTLKKAHSNGSQGSQDSKGFDQTVLVDMMAEEETVDEVQNKERRNSLFDVDSGPEMKIQQRPRGKSMIHKKPIQVFDKTSEGSVPRQESPKVKEKQIKKEVVQPAQVPVEPVEDDYTTQAELDALVAAHPVPQEHDVVASGKYAVNCVDFFQKIFGDDAPNCVSGVMQGRGDILNFLTKWKEPETKEDSEYKKLKVISTRQMDVTYLIKSTFVKAAPTLRTFMMLEQTSEKIVFRVINKSREVPYCDSFGVEEEVLITSPKGAKCCAVRHTQMINWYKSTMMKSLVKSGVDNDGKIGMEATFKYFGEVCGNFVEKKRPVVAKVESVGDEGEDYTTEAELRALHADLKTQDNHTVWVDICLSMNVEEFWRLYYEFNAEFCEEILAAGTENTVSENNPWRDPANDEEKVYRGQDVKKYRMSHMIYPVKGNPFLKEAPSRKYFYVVEDTPTRKSWRILTRTHDIPYCDTFAVEEQWDVACPSPNSKCAILRQTSGANWFKSTMMKSVILSSVKKETEHNMASWVKALQDRGHGFVEKKRTVAGVGKKKKAKKNYESSHKLNQDASRPSMAQILPQTVPVEQKKDDTVLHSLLGAIIFLLLWAMWRLGGIQSVQYVQSEQLLRLQEQNTMLQTLLTEKLDLTKEEDKI